MYVPAIENYNQFITPWFIIMGDLIQNFVVLLNVVVIPYVLAIETASTRPGWGTGHDTSIARDGNAHIARFGTEKSEQPSDSSDSRSEASGLPQRATAVKTWPRASVAPPSIATTSNT